MNTWTERRVNLLRALWTEGLTATVIAERLGGEVTRNAVIGKAHRLHLEARADPINRKAKPMPPSKSSAVRDKKRAARKAVLNLTEPEETSRSSDYMRPWAGEPCRHPNVDQCQYIVGEFDPKKPNHCCSPHTLAGQPYCAQHYDDTHIAGTRRVPE